MCIRDSKEGRCCLLVFELLDVMKKRVVITGMGLVTPLGTDLEQVWQRLICGDSGITLITDPVRSIFRSKIAGKCLDFSPEPYIEHKEVKKIERFAQFAYVAGIHAVSNSGIDFEKEDPFRCACVVGLSLIHISEPTRPY